MCVSPREDSDEIAQSANLGRTIGLLASRLYGISFNSFSTTNTYTGAHEKNALLIKQHEVQLRRKGRMAGTLMRLPEICDTMVLFRGEEFSRIIFFWQHSVKYVNTEALCSH
eukprot:6189523-Pleurochrysis_carterae.AAC.1